MRRHVMLLVSLIGKDWQLFLADRRAAMLSLAVPIVLASTFGILFDTTSAQSNGSTRLPLLIAMEGNGPFTQRVVEELLISERLDAKLVDRASLNDRLANHSPGVAVVFGPDFERMANWSPGIQGERPRIEILHNPLCENESRWAEGVVSEVVMQRLAKERLSPLLGTQANTLLTLPFEVTTTPLVPDAHAGFNSYAHSFSGMTLQYLLFWGMESGLLLLRERQRPLWARLRSAPISLGMILTAKALGTASIAFVQVLATFGFGALVFGVSINGSWIGFLLLAGVVSALSASTGLLVAAIGGTEARARSLCILAILGVSLLGGLWMPSFVLPGWARDVAVALPTTWAMRGLDGVTWQSQPLSESLVFIGVVAGFTLFFFLIAIARFLTSEARRQRGHL
jgi:ABC-2 type transport system permease protein